MTHKTCDVLKLLEDLGLQVGWSETFGLSIRRTVYALRADDDEGERWIVVGDHESAVANALLEQLEWDVYEDYNRDPAPVRLTPHLPATPNETLP